MYLRNERGFGKYKSRKIGISTRLIKNNSNKDNRKVWTASVEI